MPTLSTNGWELRSPCTSDGPVIEYEISHDNEDEEQLRVEISQRADEPCEANVQVVATCSFGNLVDPNLEHYVKVDGVKVSVPNPENSPSDEVVIRIPFDTLVTKRAQKIQLSFTGPLTCLCGCDSEFPFQVTSTKKISTLVTVERTPNAANPYDIRVEGEDTPVEHAIEECPDESESKKPFGGEDSKQQGDEQVIQVASRLFQSNFSALLKTTLELMHDRGR